MKYLFCYHRMSFSKDNPRRLEGIEVFANDAAEAQLKVRDLLKISDAELRLNFVSENHSCPKCRPDEDEKITCPTCRNEFNVSEGRGTI